MTSRITMKDIYLGYDYKTYDMSSNTVPVPYIKKDEVSEHKYKLTYREWKTIMLCYFKYLLRYLLTGKQFILPNRLGSFQLLKWKPAKRKVNFAKTKEVHGGFEKDKLIYHMNHHTRGFNPFFMWHRYDTRFAFKWHWRFKLNRRVFKAISDTLLSDTTLINKLHQK